MAYSKAKKSKNQNTTTVQQPQDRMMNDVEFNSTPSTSTGVTGFAPIPSTSSSSLMIPQEEIILKFMQVTNMNREFSLKCLEENSFNPDAAYDVFQKLQVNNLIPPEAFIK